MNNNYDIVGLYDHNIEPYKKIKKAFDDGEKVVGIVHATGTGKTYIALQLAYDNKNKKIMYISPSNGIIEHVKEIIDNNSNLDLDTDFANLEFKTYTSLVNLSKEEIEALDVDLLILDEFHHIGAPVWGDRVNRIIETHSKINVFGMTAYTVRDRGTIYERDMIDPDTYELFSNKIVSRYDLVDAMLDGVLPTEISYRTIFNSYQYAEIIYDFEDRVDKLAINEKDKYKELIKICKKRITSVKGVADLVKSNVKKDGKFIYFCPPGAEIGINDIDTIMNEVKEWFSEELSEDDMVFYVSTSKMGNEGKLNRDAFYKDETLDGKTALGKLRIMFAINQYNEGIHAPNVDGVIMGRSTLSDNVYFEQLGRALFVIKGLESKKPIVIDLTNNYEYIKELEDNLKTRIKDYQQGHSGIRLHKKLEEVSFDIKIENEELYETLRYLKDRLYPTTWDEMYKLAEAYRERYGDLEVPISFRTKDGKTRDNEGKNLGIWIRTQRDFNRKGCLLTERKQLLDKLGMRFDANKFDTIWKSYYELAKNYYQKHHNLEVPTRFKTKNGYSYDEVGKALGNWIRTQRFLFEEGHLSLDRKELLEKIGMRFNISVSEKRWQKMYGLAKIYYEAHGNLDVPSRFKTLNGIVQDNNGEALGSWIKTQKELENKKMLSLSHKELLDKIGMRYEIRDYDKEWKEMYSLAKSYYEEYKDLNISQTFKTKDGVTYDKNGKNLGTWIVTQRRYYQENKLSKEKKQLLDLIEMRFETRDYDKEWMQMYELAKKYFNHYGNLEINSRFITKDGITNDEDGKKLGKWITNQRTENRRGNITNERKTLLESIGMRFDIKRNVNNSSTFCDEYGIDKEKNREIIKYLGYKEMEAKTNFLRSRGIDILTDGILHEIYSMSSDDIEQKYGIDLKSFAKKQDKPKRKIK